MNLGSDRSVAVQEEEEEEKEEVKELVVFTQQDDDRQANESGGAAVTLVDMIATQYGAQFERYDSQSGSQYETYEAQYGLQHESHYGSQHQSQCGPQSQYAHPQYGSQCYFVVDGSIVPSSSTLTTGETTTTSTSTTTTNTNTITTSAAFTIFPTKASSLDIVNAAGHHTQTPWESGLEFPELSFLQPLYDAIPIASSPRAVKEGVGACSIPYQAPQEPRAGSNSATLNTHVALIEDWFMKNGAHHPPVPCNYCKRLRLQCLIIQTTAANPNPIESCSSCVALYRDCSLAERSKRKAQAFETALPVIGHLHGVAEEEEEEEDGVAVVDPVVHANIDMSDGEQQPQSRATPSVFSCRRKSARSIKRTRVLRDWFAAHMEHPYPTEEEKTALVGQCGLSRTQVINWFANARRRQRLTAQSHLNNSAKIFFQGSPMPPSSMLSGMSPMERWKSSPPSDEHVSQAEVEECLSNSGIGRGNTCSHSHHSEGRGEYILAGLAGMTGPPSSVSGLDASSNSTSSALSFYQSDDGNIFSLSAQSSVHDDQERALGQHGGIGNGSSFSRSHSRGRSRSQSYSHSYGHGHGHGHGHSNSTTLANRNENRMFQCTFCLQGFKKKYDWVRHERSIHLPGLDCWVCAMPLPKGQSCLVWRIDQVNPECVFCGQTSPTDEHMQSHEFQVCAERPAPERTFTRKDHLWQHLHKFHRCRKWKGWKPDLHLLQRRKDEIESECGFCRVTMSTWDERAEHLANHFRHGATMADWVGGSGVKTIHCG